MNSASAARAVPAVEASGVHKSYAMARGMLTVLRGADLSVAPGETVAVLGASGAGKSTLLHILGALDSPDSGSVRLFGEDVSGMGQGRRARIRASVIGFVFQSYHLLPEMDVIENVALPAMALPFASRTRAKRRAAAAELLERVGLGDRTGHTPLELSGGEQQRVAIARALINDPSVILADEPTGNLDDETGAQVLSCLFGMARARERTLIVVTHSEKVAAACDRRVRLAEGCIHPA